MGGWGRFTAGHLRPSQDRAPRSSSAQEEVVGPCGGLTRLRAPSLVIHGSSLGRDEPEQVFGSREQKGRHVDGTQVLSKPSKCRHRLNIKAP